MGKAANILAGSVATAMVAVGVASLTGTVRWPTFSGPPAAGGVQAQQATGSPSPSTEPSPPPNPSPSPTQAPAPPPPPPPAPAPHKKHKG